MAQLSPEVRALLEGPNYGSVATVMPDGSPQVTTVWLDTDGEHVIFNCDASRRKFRNLQRDPRVAISVVDQADPSHRQAIFRGRVVEVTAEGADAHIDFLSNKYQGLTPWPGRSPRMQRRIVKVLPERVIGPGHD